MAHKPSRAKGQTGKSEKKASAMASWKPGNQPKLAREVGGKADFGVPEGVRPTRERDYVSENTKRSDRWAATTPSSEHEGGRTSGAGAIDSGPGSGSGGDLDTDILGVGQGGSGISASGPGDAPGPDDTDGSSATFAGGPPARGENQTLVGKVGGNKRVKGSVVQRDDLQSSPTGQGADAATNPVQDDDSFAGEISSGEASGDDLGIPPSSDTQG